MRSAIYTSRFYRTRCRHRTEFGFGGQRVGHVRMVHSESRGGVFERQRFLVLERRLTFDANRRPQRHRHSTVFCEFMQVVVVLL